MLHVTRPKVLGFIAAWLAVVAVAAAIVSVVISARGPHDALDRQAGTCRTS